MAGAQFCFFAAVSRMQVGPALMIEYTAPAAVVVWMWLRHGSARAWLTLAGAGVAALGLVLVLDLVSGTGLDPVGVLWALGAMVGMTGVLRHLRRRGQRPAADHPGRGRAARRGPRCWASSAWSE